MEPATARFGIFELDPAAGELRRNGSPVRLAPQPFQVLRLLVEREGELVDRNLIRREVWGDTAVDFDRSLNVCIAQIRAALNDDAESPRFIQTVPRKGYRFLASVGRPPVPARKRWWLPAGIAVLAIALAGYRLAVPPDPVVRIAVLPFQTTGLSAPEAEQLDGIFDELLTSLASAEPDRIRVIGRRSVERMNRTRSTLKEIGRQLNVRYATEGTARKNDGLLKVAVRLVQTDRETVVWSETFDQEGGGAAFEESVVARVSAAIFSHLFPNMAPRAREAVCRQGWEAYRAGRVLAGAGSIDGLQRSLTFFAEAPCAASQAALSEALVRLARIDSRFRGNWERARQAARQALQADPEMGGAHLALGNVAFWHDWDWQTAERELRTALRRNPSDPDAHHDLAWLYVSAGRRAEAMESLARALALDPLSARTNMDSAWLLLQAGRFRESAEQARRTLQVDPQMKEAYACLSRALLYAGDVAGALAAAQPELAEPDRARLAGLTPRDAIRKLMESRLSLISDPYQRALRLAWLGSRDAALEQLEAALRARSSMMPLVAVDPGFAALRNDPRFQKIVRDVGR